MFDCGGRLITLEDMNEEKCPLCGCEVKAREKVVVALGVTGPVVLHLECALKAPGEPGVKKEIFR
jgi:hypothetical protein